MVIRYYSHKVPQGKTFLGWVPFWENQGFAKGINSGSIFFKHSVPSSCISLSLASFRTTTWVHIVCWAICSRTWYISWVLSWRCWLPAWFKFPLLFHLFPQQELLMYYSNIYVGIEIATYRQSRSSQKE